MTDELRVSVERRENGAILYTKGYINNVGGEEIANRAYELMDGGVKTLLLNLRETSLDRTDRSTSGRATEPVST